MPAPTPFPVGLPSGRVNVAVQRPTVNVKEAENVGEQLAAAVNHAKEVPDGPRFSKHGTFGPKRITHPGLEEED
jgi:hypothetical protein